MLSSLLRERAVQWTVVELPRPDEPAGPIEPDTAYLSVFLRSTHVVDIRRGIRRIHGAVQSAITLSDRDGGIGEFFATVSPSRLHDVDPAHLDRHLQFNQRLLGPVPYSGGDVEVEVGLFSVGTSYLTGPYLELLGSLTDAATVTFFGAAAPFVEPLRLGIRALSDSADVTHLEIGFSTTWTAPRSGWIVAARAQRLDMSGVSVNRADGRLLDAQGEPVVDVPYLVLEVSAARTRDDWATIPELSAAYAALRREYRNGDAERADQAMAVLRRTALTCKDLLFDDALVILDKLARRFEAMGPPTPAVRGTAQPFPALTDFSPFDDV